MKTYAVARVGAYAACAAVLLSWAGLGLAPAEAANSRSPDAKLASPNRAAKTVAAKAAKAAKAPANAAYTSGKDPQTTSSITPAEPADPGCMRTRKRLWVEGDGWVVRRVTTCY